VADVPYGAYPSLEHALADLGRRVEFPPTPNLAASVRARIEERRREPWWQVWLSPWPRALAVALVVVLALISVGLLASPEARQAVAERLGIGGVSVVHVPDVPTAAPAATPGASPAGSASPAAIATPSPVPGAALGLGARVTLEEAQRRFGSTLFMPELGTPDAVYVAGDSEVSFVYAPRPDLPASAATRGVGLVLTQFRASIDQQMLGQKGIGPNTGLEQVQVGTSRGLWIAGAPHLFLRTPTGAMRDVPARLAGNTVLWEQSGLTLRLESGLDRDSALRIAAAVR
jgi:hypothetical protein